MVIDSDPPTYTRRQIGQMAIGGTISTLMSGALGTGVGVLAEKLLSETEQERMNKLGLGEYAPLLSKYRFLRETFQQAPNFSDSPISSLEGVLSSAANGNTTYIKRDIDLLANNRSTEMENAVADAHRYVDELTFKTDGTDANPEEMKRLYHQYADLFPAMILALAPNKNISVNIGTAWASSLKFMGVPPSSNQEATAVVFLHEFGHRAEANWREFIKYVDHRLLINYWETTLDNISRLAKLYFSLPWEQASAFKHG